MRSINYGLVGIRIRNKRRKLHMSQTFLAESTGLSVPYISLMENGHKNPSLLAITHISEALDLSLDYLLFGIGSPDSHFQQSKITDLLSDCSESDQKLLLDFLQLTKELLEQHGCKASE